MTTILTIIEATLSVIIVTLVLLQQRAAGITALGSGVNSVQIQRRGAEKILYQTTIICATALIVLSIVQWYVA